MFFSTLTFALLSQKIYFVCTRRKSIYIYFDCRYKPYIYETQTCQFCISYVHNIHRASVLEKDKQFLWGAKSQPKNWKDEYVDLKGTLCLTCLADTWKRPSPSKCLQGFTNKLDYQFCLSIWIWHNFVTSSCFDDIDPFCHGE